MNFRQDPRQVLLHYSMNFTLWQQIMSASSLTSCNLYFQKKSSYFILFQDKLFVRFKNVFHSFSFRSASGERKQLGNLWRGGSLSDNIAWAVVLMCPAEVQRYCCTACPSSSLVLMTLKPSAGGEKEKSRNNLNSSSSAASVMFPSCSNSYKVSNKIEKGRRKIDKKLHIRIENN